LSFALKVVDDRGHVSTGDVAALHEVGFKDEQVVELIAHVALNLFTNCINVALEVPVDFPKMALTSARSHH
jgi:alkylhydroperoxidase family enzyme